MLEKYIPKGMLEKEYRWEWVNYQLYYYLSQINPFNELNNVVRKLIKQQEQQLFMLQQSAGYLGVQLGTITEKVETYKNIAKVIEELYYREYQLLQEYKSYAKYFLPYYIQEEIHLKEFINSQMEQVNLLMQIKNTLSKLNKQSDDSYHLTTNKINKEEQKVLKNEYLIEKGYRLDKVVGNLTYPTAITFDENNNIYVLEAGFAYGDEPGKGRLLRLEKDGKLTVFADGFLGPATGVVYHDNYFYVAEGGRGFTSDGECGRISRIAKDGTKQIIVSGLKSCGDHFTGDVRFGPDGKLYFTVGTYTNSAVVGTDNTEWLKYYPQSHDYSARDIKLKGKNFISPNTLSKEKDDIAITGAFKPFNESSVYKEKIKGQPMANGVIYSCNPDGSDLKIIADGFRNPFGLRFSPFNGKMYVTDNGGDVRGSRPILNDWDNFWEVSYNGWHGWPDFFSGLPVTLPHFHPENSPYPTFLLKKHVKLATQPVTRFEEHSSSDKFDFSTSEKFGHVKEVFVAQLGNMGPKPEYGFKVVRANIETGQIRDFLVNPLGEKIKTGPIRPVAATFSPDGNILYIVDFGILSGKDRKNTGSLWKVEKNE